MNIVAISGSLRAKSSNNALLKSALCLAPDGVSLSLYPSLGDLPHFNPDLDGDSMPESAREFRALIASADGVLISSPEYAHGIPGVLKNALDWLVSDIAFAGKPVVLINASAGDAAHATSQLIEVLKTMCAEVLFVASVRSAAVRGYIERGGTDNESEVAQAIHAGFSALTSRR